MSTDSTLRVLSHVSDYSQGRSVVIGIEHGNGGFSYIQGPLTLTRHDPQTMLLDPTFGPTMGAEFLQAALEHAWSIGLRPKNWRLESTEQVAAMDNHLQDMRRMVFGDTIVIPPFIKQEGSTQ